MIVSTHETHHPWEVVKWIALLAMAALLIVGIANYTAGLAAPPEPPATVYIVSQWSGMFRASEYQGGPPLVEVGSFVESDTVVCMIEEIMVEIPNRSLPVTAGVRGTVTQILVSDGDYVMAGQPLFALRPEDAIASR